MDNNINETEKKPKSELEPQVIGTLPAEKSPGIIGTIVFFVVLIGFTVGLPYIKDYVDKYNAQKIGESSTMSSTKSQTEMVVEPVELLYYEIDPNVIFNVDTLRFNNISKEYSDDYYLIITITNNSDKVYNFDKDYFIELYNSDKTLLERVKVRDTKNMDVMEERTFKFPINITSYNTATLLTVSLKTEDDYIDYTLINKENGEDTLICTNNFNTIKYIFEEEKLVKINDIFEFTTEDITLYDTKLKEYQTLVSSYNNVEGVSSNIVNTDLSFTVNTLILINDRNIKTLNNIYYFEKNTKPKVVKFEMEAMRYTCN